MAPIIATLMAQGLSLLGNAVLVKGQDVIEEKLGVKLNSASHTELLKLQQEHEEFLLDVSIKKIELELEAEKAAQTNITQRWQADMLSDSWLSKNVRPMVLVYWTVIISIMAFFSGWLGMDSVFIEIIKISYGVILSAYFLGRSVEKVIDMKERGK